MSQLGQSKAASAWREFAVVLAVLAVILAFLFRDGLAPNRTVFNNDGPLGAISSDSAKPGPRMHGAWQDLNWLGRQEASSAPTLSFTLGVLGHPYWFSKILAPISLLFLGLSAWFCFRQWKFTPIACLLGGIAAALNGDFLPTACWGVCAQPIAFGFSYLAIGALANLTSTKGWIRVVLAGLAVGLNVMEAYDIGALFSIAVAAFVMFQAMTGEGSPGRRFLTGCVRLAVVAGFAAIIASATLATLVGTQIKDVGGMAQDAETKAARWDEATMWSLPKREALSIVVPGLFGLRMSPPPADGSHYWGAIGRHPSWDRWFKNQNPEEPPRGPIRYGGGSGYAGALVVVVIFWALFQSFRKTGGVYSPGQRRMIWFWAGLALVSLVFAFGRFAPFYQLFYKLPYASTIRNPTKFVHTLEWALVILFAFGADALSRNFLKSQVAVAESWKAQWSAWRAKSSVFDRRWFLGSLAALAFGVVAWIFYGSSATKLAQYLQTVQFPATMTKEIADFSVHQLGWAIVLYGIALALVLLLIAGCFNGKRARWGGIALVVFLTVDLTIYAGWQFGAANRWVVTYNWKDWLEPHPLIDYLKKDAYQNRVTVAPFPFDPKRLPPEMSALPEQHDLLSKIYSYQWTQHQFPHYNIRSAEVVQEPRVASDKLAYMLAVGSVGQIRMWELIGANRFLSPAALLPILNQHPQFDAKLQRFRLATRFDIVRKPGAAPSVMGDPVTTVINTNGAYAVLEFGGALPHAKLFSRWETPTNDPAVLRSWVKGFEGRVPPEFYNALAGMTNGDLAILKRLGAPEFDPMQSVIVSGENAPPPATVATNLDAGTVEYVSYSPRRVVLRAKVATPAVLLLNDRYDTDWRVTVDGKPAPMFRGNFVARGVQLTPGEHTVEFNFGTGGKALYVSFAAMGLGALLLGILAFTKNREPQKAETPAPAPTPKSGKK